MTKALKLPHLFAVAMLFLTAIGPAYSQSISPVGAWVSRGPWNPAPREVNRDLRAAGAQIIYFEGNGVFTLWSGTLYSEGHLPPTISEGDAETLYSGDWVQLSAGPKIRMRKVYADVRMKGETMPGQEEVVITQRQSDRILFKGIWFRRTPSLDGPMQKYADGVKQRLDHN